MKILITGASGQLGSDICALLDRRGLEFQGINHTELDIRSRSAVAEKVCAYRPDAVIHCAAYTAVDRAEDEPEACWAVNVDGTKNIALACRETGAKMLYISTDYVFSGDKEGPYQTTDGALPRSVYGRSKLAGELAVQSLLERCFIVRISWTFGKNGNNFVKTMIRLAEKGTAVNVVCDQTGSPTYTADLAPLLCDMVMTDKYGIYHATNEGECSWADFAEAIFRCSGRDAAVGRITTDQYPARAVRPRNSRMSKRSLSEAGFARLPNWQDALVRYLREWEK